MKVYQPPPARGAQAAGYTRLLLAMSPDAATDRVPTPSWAISTLRRAHAETERGLQFSALLDRIAMREAERDPNTGLTAAEAASEVDYRSRAALAPHHRVRSVHNPLLAAEADRGACW